MTTLPLLPRALLRGNLEQHSNAFTVVRKGLRADRALSKQRTGRLLSAKRVFALIHSYYLREVHIAKGPKLRAPPRPVVSEILIFTTGAWKPDPMTSLMRSEDSSTYDKVTSSSVTSFAALITKLFYEPRHP